MGACAVPLPYFLTVSFVAPSSPCNPSQRSFPTSRTETTQTTHLEVLDLLLRHDLHHHVRLELLEVESEALMRVVLLVPLILRATSAECPEVDRWIDLVEEDEREVRVLCGGVEDEADQSVEGRLLGHQVE